MAIITNRNLSVAALHPAIKLVSHDVAVRARRWIVGHIRSAAGIAKGINAHPEQQTYDHGQQNRSGTPSATTCSHFHSVQ